jgi:opacity protein-like surface antigen
MVSKRALLASSAFLFAGTATASADGLYLNVFAGANFQNDASAAQAVNTTTISYGTTTYFADDRGGFVLGGTIGTRLDGFMSGLRLEGEVSWRKNDASGRYSVNTFSTPSSGLVESEMSTFAVLANLWYDIDTGGKLVPYVGGGIGWGYSEAEGVFHRTSPTTITNFAYDTDGSGFVWQLGAGVRYPIQDGMKLGLGYRYFRGPEIDNDVFFGKYALALEHERDNHAVTLDMTFDLN